MTHLGPTGRERRNLHKGKRRGYPVTPPNAAIPGHFAGTGGPPLAAGTMQTGIPGSGAHAHAPGSRGHLGGSALRSASEAGWIQARPTYSASAARIVASASGHQSTSV